MKIQRQKYKQNNETKNFTKYNRTFEIFFLNHYDFAHLLFTFPSIRDKILIFSDKRFLNFLLIERFY